jgi:hypothetical protein
MSETYDIALRGSWPEVCSAYRALRREQARDHKALTEVPSQCDARKVAEMEHFTDGLFAGLCIGVVLCLVVCVMWWATK